jgi:PAS domain S-box-containing protein
MTFKAGRTERSASYISSFAVILANIIGIVTIIGIIVIALSVIKKFEELIDAETENITWIFAQLEVEQQNLLLAAYTAREHTDLATPDLAIANDVWDSVAHQFDIYYSRVRLAFSMGEWIGNDLLFTESPRDAMDRLVHNQGKMAAIVDADAPHTGSDLAQLIALIEEDRANVRVVALEALHSVGDSMIEERKGWTRLFAGYIYLTILVLLFAVAIVLISNKLHSTLLTQNKSLIQNEARLERIIEASMNAVIVLDENGMVYLFNEAAVRLFGYSKHELLERSGADMLVPSGMVRRMRTAGESKASELFLGIADATVRRGFIRRKDGTTAAVEATIVADSSNPARPLLIGFIRDIVQERAADRKMRRSRLEAKREAMQKGRFLAVMSHELRTPLHGIIASLDLIDPSKLGSGDVEMLQLAQHSAQIAVGQVDDVLEVSRLDSKIGDKPIVIAPTLLIRHLVEQALPLATEGNNIITFTAKGDLPDAIVCRRRAFHKSVQNLLSNALKFTRNGCVTIEMEALPADGNQMHLCVRVIDTGVGIPHDKLELIFDDFETLGASYSRFANGTGLGLGIMRRAVQQMDGKFGVSSTVGYGSTFWFSVPMILPAIVKTHLIPAAPESLPRSPHVTARHVLVVDDNKINQLVIARMLERLGHIAEVADNGHAAIRMAHDAAYDIILMDISMPGMDGFETTRRIRSGGANADTDVIGVTAHMYIDESWLMPEVGMSLVLTKPFTIDVLRDCIDGIGPETIHALSDTSTEHVLDTETITQLRELMGESGCNQMIARFLAETKTVLREMCDTEGFQDDDRSQSLHKVAGSAAFIGARRLHGLLCHMEDAARLGLDLRSAPLTAETLSALGDTECALLLVVSGRHGHLAELGHPNGRQDH